ncbi:MAG: DUF1599 domain-containing protein [Microscillaceae bacterium]|nr:DUF1599 domain-containing protein [Microscillaceae bacterium]
MNSQTPSQYKKIIAHCKELFDKKNQDYGTSWRILRLPSCTDQIFIKAKRIRSIQEKGTQRVSDTIPAEFVGIVNYAIIALMQIELASDKSLEIDRDRVLDLYTEIINKNMILLDNKNHDYDEAWRDMRVESMTDQILMKLLRIRQIEDNQGKTIVSEGVESIYRDIINYAVFCLIKLNFHNQNENN